MTTEPAPLHSTGKVKLIRQEKFIRFCGMIMMASPFVNFYLSIAPVENVGDKTSLPVLLHLARSISMIHWMLWGASFVVGVMMLKGRRSSWISVLAILGVFIVFDFLNFKKNLARGWEQPITSIAFNLFIFILVYVQEFRQASQPRPKKVKVVEVKASLPPPKPRGPNPILTWAKSIKMPQVKMPVIKLPEIDLKSIAKGSPPQTVSQAPPKPAPVVQPSLEQMPVAPKQLQPNVVPSRVAVKPADEITDHDIEKLPDLVGHVIDFDGMGPWARIVNMDRRELYMRGFREPHPLLETRAVEIDIGQETYRLRMTSRQGQLYTFRFEAVARQKPKLRLVS